MRKPKDSENHTWIKIPKPPDGWKDPIMVTERMLYTGDEYVVMVLDYADKTFKTESGIHCVEGEIKWKLKRLDEILPFTIVATRK